MGSQRVRHDLGTEQQYAWGRKRGQTGTLLLLLSRFSRVRLCVDSIDSSPPGSTVPGILQARTLEWGAISFSNACMHAKSLQSWPPLCNPMDSSQTGFSAHWILHARILEWVAISLSKQIGTASSKCLDINISFFKNILFIYLAALVLSCSVWNSDQRSNSGPLHQKRGVLSPPGMSLNILILQYKFVFVTLLNKWNSS